MRTRRRSALGTVLMVGPIPVAGRYIGGIGMLMKQLLEHWNGPTALVHLNTELFARSFGKTGRMNARNLVLCIANCARLFWLMVTVRPTIVHYHTSRGMAFVKDMMLAGLLRGVFRATVVLHVHSSDADAILASPNPRFRRFQLTTLLRCCDRLVVLSNNLVDDLAAVLGEDAAKRFRAQCIAMHNFTLLSVACRQHQEPADAVRLFYIGSIGREKGIYDTIEAVRRLKNEENLPVRVVCAGPFNDEREEQHVRRIVTDCHMDDTVLFAGIVSGQEKEAQFLQADIFVLPSYSEGIPLSMLEAMAHGLPVVVSGVGGIPEVVRDGREGRIVKPGDVDGLCRMLRELIGSVRLREQMGTAARRRIEAHYTVEEYMRQLQQLYGSLAVPQERMECAQTEKAG